MKLYPSTSVIYLLQMTMPTTDRILHKMATMTEKLRGAISSTFIDFSTTELIFDKAMFQSAGNVLAYEHSLAIDEAVNSLI